MYKFNYLDKTFTRYLPGICIQHIHEDVHQNFWLATALDGLGLFHRETGEANFYNQDNGLPTSQVEAIVEDNNGNLWLLTPVGISTFNPQKQVFTNFYIQHGLPSNNFHMCGINSSNGRIWMATGDEGVVVFNPNEIQINTTPPKIVLTDIKISNKSLSSSPDSPLKQNISVAEEIHLAHWQNDISLECAALHFSHPQQNQYAFWLENYDRDWYLAGTNRVAAYTNLDPGEYIFHAKGANSDNVWNEKDILPSIYYSLMEMPGLIRVTLKPMLTIKLVLGK